ncbi:hypothetical protein ABEY55_20005 [Priestia aryabhattai]|uniref:hypothetical protein n=1 Tax=Priestia aryabhattai TaxID=412384 RepID=UPI003D282D24
MKNLLKWIKAIELNVLFATFVFERPTLNDSIAKGSVKENEHTSKVLELLAF